MHLDVRQSSRAAAAIVLAVSRGRYPCSDSFRASTGCSQSLYSQTAEPGRNQAILLVRKGARGFEIVTHKSEAGNYRYLYFG